MNYGKYNPYESGDVEIISENDDLKIVKVLSKDASFYFGGDIYYQNWDDNFRDGDLYFIISSNENTPIVSIHNRDNNESSVIRVGYNSDRFGNTDDLKKFFPDSVKLLTPVVRFGPTFEFLKSVYKGYEPRWDENGGDKIIEGIKFNERSPNSSIVTIEFSDDDDFLNIFDLEENDIYEWRYYMSDYSGVDYDDYRYTEDWSEGDFINYAFNEDNKERMVNIIRTFFPSADLTNNKQIAELMDKVSSDFSDYVVGEYMTEWENCIYRTIRDELRSELENPFYRFGIKEKSFAYKYETTVGTLLTWYKQLKMEDEDLKSLLEELIKKFDKTNRGGWSEMRYGTDCPNFEYDQYQNYVSDKLDKVEETYEEDERFVNYYEFIELQKYVDKEYGFNKWIPIKTDKNKFFRIEEIDPGTNKIIITFRDNQSDNREEKRSIDSEDLKRLETQYELFEEIKKIIGKLK